MPRISQQKKDKIAEQILHHLFSASPQAVFTAQIAKEIARDEEFTKGLLQDLKTKGLVAEVIKNSTGEDYARRRRWRLSNTAFRIYSDHQ